jgi:very-short-patch-repair endonuclease
MPHFKNLLNKQFGRLTVIEITDKRTPTGKVIWKCKCSCNKIHEVNSNSLLCGSTKSCGCLQKEWAVINGKTRLHDVTGQTINGIKIIRMSDKRSGRNAYCFALCPVCGNEWEVQASLLRTRHSTQCKTCSFRAMSSKTAERLFNKLEDKLDLKIIREYRINNRFFDGYIPELKLLIESDGSYWHSKPESVEIDAEKDKLAKEAGLQLIRVTNNNEKDHPAAIEKIYNAIVISS